MLGDGFSEGRWNYKAIPIMNWLVQMTLPLSPLPSPLSPPYRFFRLIFDGILSMFARDRAFIT